MITIQKAERSDAEKLTDIMKKPLMKKHGDGCLMTLSSITIFSPLDILRSR